MRACPRTRKTSTSRSASMARVSAASRCQVSARRRQARAAARVPPRDGEASLLPDRAHNLLPGAVARLLRVEVDNRLAGGATVTASSRSGQRSHRRSEEHTSELQSQSNLVCRLLLEKKKKKEHKQT